MVITQRRRLASAGAGAQCLYIFIFGIRCKLAAYLHTRNTCCRKSQRDLPVTVAKVSLRVALKVSVS